jgi:hypothetical protein
MIYVPLRDGLILCVLALFLSGCCGNYTLIGFMDSDHWLSDDLKWRYEQESRLPRGETEGLVVRVAATQRSLVDGNMVIVYISNDQKDSLVVTVEDTSGSKDCFAPKKVVRYLVKSGRIHAVQGPHLEPFPDVAFERSVLHTAGKAATEGGFSVVTIRDWLQPVALKGVVFGNCTVEVTAFAAENDGPGPRLCAKMVNICKHD